MRSVAISVVNAVRFLWNLAENWSSFPPPPDRVLCGLVSDSIINPVETCLSSQHHAKKSRVVSSVSSTSQLTRSALAALPGRRVHKALMMQWEQRQRHRVRGVSADADMSMDETHMSLASGASSSVAGGTNAALSHILSLSARDGI